MHEIFPSMNSKPAAIKVFALIPWSLWIYILFPFYLLPLIGAGLWENPEHSVWLQIGNHVLSALPLLFLLWSYLREEWSMVAMDGRYYLKHIALTVVLIVGVELWLFSMLKLGGVDTASMREGLPVAEMLVSQTPYYLIRLEPLWGTVVMSVFVPISICALFYCFAFSPVCCRNTWLAYLSVAVVALIPTAVNILWENCDASLGLNMYLASLPVHFLACWSYQKTDNVWTPLLSLSLANLLISLLQIFIK